MAVTHGMNIQEVEQLAARLREAADRIDTISMGLDREVRTTPWAGPDAERFKGQWWPAHRGHLGRTAQDLRGFGQSAQNNATEQARTSSVDGGGGGTPAPSHVVSRRSYTVADSGSVPFFGNSSETVVETVELADGTYRVTVGGTLDAQGRASLSGLLGTSDLADLGFEQSVGAGFEVEFVASDAEAAAELEDALRGRADHWTNMTTFANVERAEAIRAGTETGASVASVTQVLPGQNVTAVGTMPGLGFTGGVELFNETTVDRVSGLRTDRTVFQSDLAGTSLSQEGVAYRQTVEIIRDPSSGDALTARIESRTDTIHDLRDSVDRRRDLLASGLTFGQWGNTDHGLAVQTTTYEFDVATLGDGALRDAIVGDDRAALLALAPEHGDEGAVIDAHYEGSADTSSRGLGLFSFGANRTTGSGELNLVSRHER